MSEELQDELTSINSIYDENTLKLCSVEERIYTLILPVQPSITLRIQFPEDYPESPPTILGTESVGDNLPKGHGAEFVNTVRNVLGAIYVPGSPCIFDLIVESEQRSESLSLAGADDVLQSRLAHEDLLVGDVATGRLDQSRWADAKDTDLALSDPPRWTVSETVTEKKSIFVARAIAVDSVDQAKAHLTHLLSTDKKVSRATHNITAWRIRGDNGVQFQDCDDDGETAAGSRLLHLLELMNVWDAMVVVTRWYGGVHLGSDRFRIINQVARDAIIAADLLGKDGKESRKKTQK